MSKAKTKTLQSVISSNLRLLVLLRETLRAAGTPANNPLLVTVVAQANLCGTVLPNDLRISKTELDAIRKGAGIVMAEKKAPTQITLPPTLPGSGGMVILRPDQLPR